MSENMAHSEYGLWFLVILNSAIFIIFAFSFAKPSKSKDWTSFGAFSAFVVALFTEMYGFPLSIYFLSPWLESQFPDVNWFAHDSGHFWEMIFGWQGNPHFGPFHFASLGFILLGFSVLSWGWPILHQDRHLCPHAPPSICRFRADHVWLPAAMADDSDTDHVPDSCVHVCPARLERGEGRRSRIRRRIPRLCCGHTALLAPLGALGVHQALPPERPAVLTPSSAIR